VLPHSGSTDSVESSGGSNNNNNNNKPPAQLSQRRISLEQRFQAGLEKIGKKTSSVGFLGFFWVFLFFLVVLYIFPEEGVFRVFQLKL
jgi:hypothetical protein